MAYPTTDLIDALRTAADKIESGRWHHSWTCSDNCNCGLVARALVGEKVRSPAGTWNDIGVYLVRYEGERTRSCGTSGLTYEELYDTLTDAGLTDEDFAELEHLKNESVLESMGRSRMMVDKFKARDVIEYLRTWADLLEEAQDMIEDADETPEDVSEVDDPATATVPA